MKDRRDIEDKLTKPDPLDLDPDEPKPPPPQLGIKDVGDKTEIMNGLVPFAREHDIVLPKHRGPVKSV